MTADKTVFVGGYCNIDNDEYYLYTSQWYWSMSPSKLSHSGGVAIAYMFAVNYGNNSPQDTGFRVDGNDFSAVFPVVSLNTNTITGGFGTTTDPFTVS